MSTVQPDPETAKDLGAYYTAQEVADFLVWWGIRKPQDRVIDPSFGGGVFLRAACKRLLQLKGSPAGQVFGVEIDSSVYTRISEKLTNEFGLRASHLHPVDFFSYEGPHVPLDVVVGNPPFIRYQRFNGETRQRALARAARAGVKLPELSSSWAPFVAVSVSLLTEGGRLAMVVPAEIAYAAYAKPLLSYLKANFSSVSIATFRKRLFPDLSEDTYLLLADGKGRGPGSFLHKDFEHAEELSRFHHAGRRSRLSFQPVPLNVEGGELRFNQHFLPKPVSDLYERLRSHTSVNRLGDVADVGIGYVTGANDFFHLNRDQVRMWGIPSRYLRRAVRNARGFRGTRITEEDWKQKGEEFLLQVSDADSAPQEISMYLAQGKREGVHLGFKCRTRKRWYEVPHVYKPDAVLSYMSGNSPRMLANAAEAVSPNTLHVVRIPKTSDLSGSLLATCWPNALTAISTEIEGHSLGGGMLKLEPTEAENVLVPLSQRSKSADELENEVDRLLREDRLTDAQSLVDRHFLRDDLGLTQRECAQLRQGADALRERRYSRSSS